MAIIAHMDYIAPSSSLRSLNTSELSQLCESSGNELSKSPPFCADEHKIRDDQMQQSFFLKRKKKYALQFTESEAAELKLLQEVLHYTNVDFHCMHHEATTKKDLSHSADF